MGLDICRISTWHSGRWRLFLLPGIDCRGCLFGLVGPLAGNHPGPGAPVHRLPGGDAQPALDLFRAGLRGLYAGLAHRLFPGIKRPARIHGLDPSSGQENPRPGGDPPHRLLRL